MTTLDNPILDLSSIKALFPNEWVLLGNPVMDDAGLTVFSGIPIYHSRDKREVCYIGKDKTVDYQFITLIYTGELKSHRKITGIFKRLRSKDQ
jgi:hypothetical protein